MNDFETAFRNHSGARFDEYIVEYPGMYTLCKHIEEQFRKNGVTVEYIFDSGLSSRYTPPTNGAPAHLEICYGNFLVDAMAEIVHEYAHWIEGVLHRNEINYGLYIADLKPPFLMPISFHNRERVVVEIQNALMACHGEY